MAFGVVAITVDLLPAWILPPYGATWVSAPTLNALAARGVVFDRVVADAADPSAVALEFVEGLRTGRLNLVTDDVALAAAAQAGWGSSEKVAVWAADATGTVGRPRGAAGGMRALFAEAARLASLPGAAGMLWCHATSLGREWSAPSEYRERYRDPEDPPGLEGTHVPCGSVDAVADPDALAAIRHAFAGEVTFFDECLGTLLAAADAAAGPRPPLVLLAGVRGMPLGLHGWVGPPATPCGHVAAYGESVDLPVILVDPLRRMAAQRFGGLVGPRDLAAAVESLLGTGPIVRAGTRQGCLRGLFSDWLAVPREAIFGRFPNATSVTTADWRLILRSLQEADGGGVRAELYAKPDDYFETNDVADRCTDVVESLGLLAASAAPSRLPKESQPPSLPLVMDDVPGAEYP